MAKIIPLFDNSISASVFISIKTLHILHLFDGVLVRILKAGTDIYPCLLLAQTQISASADTFLATLRAKQKIDKRCFQKKIHPMEYNLSGKWYVLYSNFPMWLKGNKKNPSFYYGTPENGHFSDTVEYKQKSKIKKIEGTDTIQGTKFIWQGKGLLRFVKSRWEILYYNFQDGIAIIHFDKTLFTPEGYDIISREKTIRPTIEKELFIHLHNLGIKDKLIKIQ